MNARARALILSDPELAFEVKRLMSPKRSGVTRRQRDILEFIASYAAEHGVSPTFDEMRDGVGLESKASVHRIVVCLEERGLIRRLANRARSIEVVEGAI